MELTVNDLRTNKQSVKTYYVIITNKDGIRKYISSPKFYWERTVCIENAKKFYNYQGAVDFSRFQYGNKDYDYEIKKVVETHTYSLEEL